MSLYVEALDIFEEAVIDRYKAIGKPDFPEKNKRYERWRKTILREMEKVTR